MARERELRIVTSPHPRKTIEAIDSSGGGLRVTFAWQLDRFAHWIEQVEGERSTRLIESHEGTPHDDWPPSPPLQSLSIEQRGSGRQVALLVGMAGTSHWSASVEALPDERSLSFDIACRVNQAPTWLGSRYTMVEQSIQRDDPSSLQLGTTTRLVIGQLDQVSLAQPEMTGSELAIEHERSATIAFPYTARWSYRLNDR